MVRSVAGDVVVVTHIADVVIAHVVVIALGAVIASIGPTSASAAPEPDAPIVDITARVVDIVISTADLRREVRIDQSPGSVRVSVDATVLFAKDSAAIRPGAAQRLDQASAALRRRGPGRVRIVGYTDDLGSAEHGRRLSLRRARAVAEVLQRDLPATYRLSVAGKGEAEPLVPNTSDRNRRMNRRVVITYVAG